MNENTTNVWSPIPEPLLTIDEISTYLRVTPRTIHTLTKKSNLPRYKVGRLVRYRLTDVLETLTVGVSHGDKTTPMNMSPEDRTV